VDSSSLSPDASTSWLLDESGTLLSASDSFQDSVELASDGKGFFAAWHDTRAGQDRVFGTRLDADGKALGDPAGIEIAVSTEPRIENRPAVAYDGAGYFVAWLESYEFPSAHPRVQAMRIGLNGERRSDEPIPIDTALSADPNGGLSVDCATSDP